MFDGKIDFMDFNKIKINYGGKLTCRKIFRRKYIIFLVISIIILIVLVSFLITQNKKITGISIEIKSFEKDIENIDKDINEMKNKNMEEEINLSNIQNDIEIMKKEIREKNIKQQEYQKKNDEIIKERDDLEKKSTSLSIQLKTEMDLKEVYDQKNTSLTTLLESLKIEYEKLLEQKGGKKDNDLSIKISQIITESEYAVIQDNLNIKGTTEKKCFDGVENNFNPFIFHEQCDRSAILLLIKTDNNERIGAFTRVSFEGTEIKQDPSAVLFNIDKNKYYNLANSEYPTIVCNPDELPQFARDLEIKSNGQGINSFPINYGDIYNNYSQELTKDHIFNIDNLEVYKIIFK